MTRDKGSHQLVLTDSEFAQFQKLLYQLAGIALSDTKKALVQGRLAKRVRDLGLRSFAEYYHFLSQKADEQQTLIDLLTTHETYFFREEHHFAFLRQIIPHLRRSTETVKLWSAACSTGEEVYSLAITLAETLGIDGYWTILGSDISQQVLQTAERGIYWLDRTRGLPTEYLKKYCLKGVRSFAGAFKIAPELCKHVTFMQINLNAPLPAIGPFHAIFLRNVMIYFDTEIKRQVVSRVIEKLYPGGYLFVGHAENLTGISNRLTLIKPSIYQLCPKDEENQSRYRR